MSTAELDLLPRKALHKTGDVDHADWNYRPLLGTISRARFRLVKELLRDRRGARLLEIGYGSGVFLPELTKYVDAVYGIDVHDKQAEVAQSLTSIGVKAELASGGAERIDFPDDFFDLVVAVSALEFVSDIDAVCREVSRVIKKGGSFVVVTPGKCTVLDLGLKILTGKSAKDDFGDRRELIIPALRKEFDIKQELAFPRYGRSLIRLYRALELAPRRRHI